MHIYISTNSYSEARNEIKTLKFSETTSEDIKIIITKDDKHKYKKYMHVNSIEAALSELEKPFKKISGEWCLQFTGQGCQRPNMMASLYKNIKPFRRHLDNCFYLYNEKFNTSLKDIIFSDSSDINLTKWTQPALFAVEYAMARTWIELGMCPTLTIGHSVGEYPAAVIAGVMDLDAGIELIGSRGLLMQSISKKGGMAAMMCNLSTIEKIIKNYNINIDIAGINSNKQTVISGDISEIKRIMEIAKDSKIRSRELIVSHAFHSQHMDSILDDFTNIAKKHKYKQPEYCKVVSNVTGKLITLAPQPEYWSQHIRSAVNYIEGIKTVSELNIQNFLELGPQPILNNMAAKIISDDCIWLASANDKAELDTFYKTAGILFENSLIDITKIQ